MFTTDVHADLSALDIPIGEHPDPDELIKAAMAWHFGPDTGSRFWLERAKTLDFDPRRDVRTFADLRLFPNVINELREVKAEDLIPRGYGENPDIAGVFESGGTTGAPKRAVFMDEWIKRVMAWTHANLDAHGAPRGNNTLSVTPTGPHMFGYFGNLQARERGGVNFTIDMDPRWVKQLIAAGRADEAGAYADHLIDQARHVLRTQRVGVLVTTPPLLERLSRDDELVDLINEKIKFILWGGAHMDADTRHLLRTEVFPEITLYGSYASTMVLGGTAERLGLGDDDPCIFDPFSPYITFGVVDPATLESVPYGERGQVVMNHVSKGMLLPNNLERDNATRIEPPMGQAGDSVADVAPVATFDNEAVIEGVY